MKEKQKLRQVKDQSSRMPDSSEVFISLILEGKEFADIIKNVRKKLELQTVPLLL